MVLWGIKTEAAFDVWSIEHLVTGISLCALSNFIVHYMFKEEINEKNRIKILFLIVIIFSLFWENLEHYIEAGLWGTNVKYWFQGVEHWSNRLIFDNLMVIFGAYIYIKKNKLLWFARIFSVLWLFFHIFIFPHSMYLHSFF